MKKYILFLFSFCACMQAAFAQGYNNSYRTYNVATTNSKSFTIATNANYNHTSNKDYNSNGSKIDKTHSEQKALELMKRIYLHFTYFTDAPLSREILLGFSSSTTDAYDYGYEAKINNLDNCDFGSVLDGEIMSIQAYGDIKSDKSVPLFYKTCGKYNLEIKLSRTQNVDPNQEIYLKDNFTDTYFDLTSLTPYQFTSTSGGFNNRFEIVFQNKSLSIEESSFESSSVYYLNNSKKLVAKNLNAATSKITFTNMLGQTVLKFNNISQQKLSNGISITNLPTGIYIISLKTDKGQIITKKIIAD